MKLHLLKRGFIGDPQYVVVRRAWRKVHISGTFQKANLKVKLPCLNDHPENTGGIIYGQSAMTQLHKQKELHHEKANHLSKQKSRIIAFSKKRAATKR